MKYLGKTTSYRATGVIIRDKKVLVIRRVKDGKQYYVLPGGWPEEGETPKRATIREVKEECCIDAIIDRNLFTIENYDRPHYFYLITEFNGEVELGGEEKEIMDEQNQFYLEWKDHSELQTLSPMYPEGLKDKLVDLLK